MLQKTEDKRLAYVLEAIHREDIRFPVAEIVKRTRDGSIIETLEGILDVFVA